MADIKDKNKPDDGNDNKKDAGTLAILCQSFIDGRYTEDSFLAALDSFNKKMNKNKTYKEHKEKGKEVEIRVSKSVTDFQRSYIRQHSEQIKKDLGIQVYLKF